MKIKKTTLVLIITNIVTLSALFAVAFHYDIPQKLLHRSGVLKADNGRYVFGQMYDVRRSLFEVYEPADATVVMLGDSITYQADWSELLSRSDIVNRGIAADTTAGFAHRLADVYALHPEVCFIMGGINDITKGIPVETIFADYVGIVEALREHRITPVIQSTLYVSNQKQAWRQINKQVNALNARLGTYAEKNGIRYIDVNRALSANGHLDETYTFDGVHLRGSGYAKWRELLRDALPERRRNGNTVQSPYLPTKDSRENP